MAARRGWYTDRTGARYAYVPTGNGKRINVRLSTCTTDAQALERATVVRELAKRLRDGGGDEFLEKVVSEAATADDARLAAVGRIVDGIVKGTERKASVKALGTTWRDVAGQWTRGELHARYPDQVPAKLSVDMDVSRVTVLDELIGDVLVTDPDWLEHAEEAMRRLPARVRASATRRQYAQAIRRVLELAVYPLKLIAANPLPKGFLPKVTQGRALQMPYPDEDAQLMAHAPVPVVYRLAYGFLARMGFRKSEIVGGEDEEPDHEDEVSPPLTWDRVDLDRGVVFRRRSKTDKPVPIVLDSGVVRALAAWKRLQPPRTSQSPVFADAKGDVVALSAEAFRGHLQAAGVDRTELHTRSKDNAPVRVHDLRALFVTVSLAQGRHDTWVRDRTSHRTITMLERYRRQARLFEELDLGGLRCLDEAIPELAAVGPSSDGGRNGTEGAPSNTSSTGESARSSPRATVTQPFDSSYGGSNPPVGTNTYGSQPSPSDAASDDSVVAVLAEALRGASAAGRWDVVAQLARELEARRLATAPNVVHLAARRQGR